MLRRYSSIVAATLVALTGCSDFGADLSACKSKATEVHRPAQASKDEAAVIVRECMRAEGWPIKDSCLDKPHLWDSPECYLR
jgi:hypothetical protein